MKKLFAIIAMFGVFAFGATQAMMAQTDERCCGIGFGCHYGRQCGCRLGCCRYGGC